MTTGEQGARKPASPVREETDGKGPGQGHLAGGRLHSAGGPGKPTRRNPGRASRPDPTNLAEAVERAVSRHRQHLRAAIPERADAPAPAPPPEARRTGRIPDRTRARHADVARLLAEGRNYRQIAADLRLSRNTVRRFARAGSPEELLVNDGTGRQPSILDEHAAYLAERWNAGCTNAARLHQELRDLGYRGGASYVRQYLARFRGNAAAHGPAHVPRRSGR
jgi:transposase